MSPRAKREIKNRLREYVQRSVTNLVKARQEIRARLKEIFDLKRPPGGMTACRLYLQLFLGEDVPTRELEVVSGISEYARRIRQLRVEEGYDITAESGKGGWTYRLASEKPDATRAELWKKRNMLRRMTGSGEARILAAFKAFVGKPLDINDLAYVSKIKAARERARDLRLHKGWRIQGKLTGRPGLKVTEYVLVSLDQLPVHDRGIPDTVYESVLERDGNRCSKCGWQESDRRTGSKRQFLEVHHKMLRSKGGSHSPENLVALCNMHHDDVHRRRIDQAGFDRWLRA